jgi:hypothetical protein
MCDRATNRAAIPDLGVADVAHRLAKQRHSLCDYLGALQVRLPDQCPQTHRIAVHLDSIETRNAVDVDKNRRPSKSQVEQRHKTLPTGKHLPFAPVLAEEVNNSLEIGRAFVRKRRRLHLN